MNMGDSREQVMLNLVVEPADIPGEPAASPGEVNCGFDLMSLPAIRKRIAGLRELCKLSFLHAVRELEH